MSTTATITSLTALSATAVDDVLPIVDVSDTTQAPSGSTKKVTTAILLAGLLPLAGGTLTGNISIVQAGAADASVSLGYSGASRAYLASIAIAGDIINGSAIGDLAIRNASGAIRVSADGGTSSILTLTSTGVSLAGALTHTGSTAGFFNKSAVARPSITTSKTGADALALALLNALGDVVGVGLVHDATT